MLLLPPSRNSSPMMVLYQSEKKFSCIPVISPKTKAFKWSKETYLISYLGQTGMSQLTAQNLTCQFQIGTCCYGNVLANLYLIVFQDSQSGLALTLDLISGLRIRPYAPIKQVWPPIVNNSFKTVNSAVKEMQKQGVFNVTTLERVTKQSMTTHPSPFSGTG